MTTKSALESIRWIFRERCWLCGRLGEHVHHLDFDHKNNQEENLILVCKKCHRTLHSEKLRFRIKEFKLEPLWAIEEGILK